MLCSLQKKTGYTPKSSTHLCKRKKIKNIIGVKNMSRIKPVLRCSEIEKEKFKQSRCLLTISVGQEVHESEHFKTTIELVNKSFNSCVMLIDDSLQRHTLAMISKNDADSFYKASLQAGDQWLERNAIYYKNLTILDKIVRWDMWLMHPYFKNKLEEVKALINFDISYKAAFDNTIDEFMIRYSRRIENKKAFCLKRARKLCFDYLIEECAALCLWPELNCHFEVYPSRRNLAMSETHTRFILPQHPSLLHAIAIKFKNRKQFKPQQLPFVEKTKEDN